MMVLSGRCAASYPVDSSDRRGTSLSPSAESSRVAEVGEPDSVAVNGAFPSSYNWNQWYRFGLGREVRGNTPRSAFRRLLDHHPVTTDELRTIAVQMAILHSNAVLPSHGREQSPLWGKCEEVGFDA